MDYTLSNEKAKRQAKLMVEYLQSQGLKIPLGHALETVARMHDAKSWNHLNAQLASVSVLAAVRPLPLRESPAQAGASEPRLFYRVGTSEKHEDKAAHVRAECYSYDKVEYAEFDAYVWLMLADDAQILALAKNGWTMEYDQRSFGEAIQTWGDSIDAVHSYVVDHNGSCDSEFWTKMGVELDAKQALSFLRAFRYPLFVQLALDITFSNDKVVEEVAFYGYNREHYQVVKSSDGNEPAWLGATEEWSYVCGPYQLRSGFKSEAEAWSALGKEAESRGIFQWDDERLAGVELVQPMSGYSSWTPNHPWLTRGSKD